jgi:hypothetical protein
MRTREKRQYPPLPPECAEAERRAELVLSCAFRGIHHVDEWRRRYAFGSGVAINIYCHGLATYDFDELTRLVVAAHDHCVRLEISAISPTHVRLAFHCRERDAEAVWDRHPTIETQIAAIRAGREQAAMR